MIPPELIKAGVPHLTKEALRKTLFALYEEFAAERNLEETPRTRLWEQFDDPEVQAAFRKQIEWMLSPHGYDFNQQTAEWRDQVREQYFGARLDRIEAIWQEVYE